MTLRSDMEAALADAHLPVRSRPSSNPPHVVVRYNGLALDTVEPLINRHSVDLWCVVSVDDDPEELARATWQAARESRIVIPVLIVPFFNTIPPGAEDKFDGAIVRCAQIAASTVS